MTVAFSQIPQPSSLVRRWDPRWRLAAILVVIAAVLVVRRLIPAVGGTMAAFILIAAANAPRRWFCRRMAGFLLLLSPFLVSMPFLVANPNELSPQSPFQFSRYGAYLALLTLCKALTIVMLMLVILITAPLETTLQAAHSLRIPGLLIQLTLMTYRYLHLIVGELNRLRIALRARGYRNRATLHSYRTVGHVMGTLLVRSHDRAERIAHAMRCRGFDGRFRSLSMLKTRFGDVLAFLFALALAAGLVLWDRLSG